MNVAGEGTIGLARMIRLARRAPLPLAGPLFGPVTSAARRAGMTPLSEDFRRLLRHGRGVDLTRLEREVGLPAALLDRGRGARLGAHPRGDEPRPARARGGRMSAQRTGTAPPRQPHDLPPPRPRHGRGVGTAISFMRLLREGLDAGVELPEALGRGALALPRDASEALRLGMRRLEGDYSDDEWGYDEQFTDVLEPLFAFLYERWWRVEVEGARRVPSHGRVLLVANHAGILPWDATMMALALRREHPLPRHPRFLVLDWAFELPWISTAIRRLGGVVASPYNALRLLEQDQLVAVFPEGAKGTGKPFSERYRLQRFGRGGFVELALRTGAPIVPVAVVGSEEIYPKIAEVPAAGPADRRSVLPRHADLPVARPARPGAAALEVADRVLRADRDRRLPGRSGGRPRARVRALRARAGDDPADGLLEPGAARVGVRLSGR